VPNADRLYVKLSEFGDPLAKAADARLFPSTVVVTTRRLPVVASVPRL